MYQCFIKLLFNITNNELTTINMVTLIVLSIHLQFLIDITISFLYEFIKLSLSGAQHKDTVPAARTTSTCWTYH